MNIGGRDFRFRPDDGRFEAESGATQYGRHRDDWGRWFGNNNPTWAWQASSCPNPTSAGTPTSPAPRPEAERLEPATRHDPSIRPAGPFPGSMTLDAANRATSANSPMPYRDDLFGPEFATSLFVSEPVHNLVHRVVLEPDGATLRGHRSPPAARPTANSSPPATTGRARRCSRPGPDGQRALDRRHVPRRDRAPQMDSPTTGEARLDLRARQRGKAGFTASIRRDSTTPADPGGSTGSIPIGLVAALDSPNGWQPRHRLAPPAPAPPRSVGDRSGSASSRPGASRPKSRGSEPSWTLQDLDADSRPRPSPTRLADDTHPQVRRNAARAGDELPRLTGIPASPTPISGLPTIPIRRSACKSL